MLESLKLGGPSRFTEELERLSTLGSPWASAIMGYIALVRGPDGKRDADRAIELCRNHAHAGDSYAQFVYAWALLFAGESNLAFETMKKATLSGFQRPRLRYFRLEHCRHQGALSTTCAQGAAQCRPSRSQGRIKVAKFLLQIRASWHCPPRVRVSARTGRSAAIYRCTLERLPFLPGICISDKGHRAFDLPSPAPIFPELSRRTFVRHGHVVGSALQVLTMARRLTIVGGVRERR